MDEVSIGEGHGGGDVDVEESADGELRASVEVAASPERVFALWADATAWPDWDPDLEEASLDGPFAAGSRGALKPASGPRTRIVLDAVEPPHAFAASARLPLCRMVFEHTLGPSPSAPDARCRVTHAVRFEGVLAPLFRRLIGPSVRRGLPGTMAGLRAAAERPSVRGGAEAESRPSSA